MRHLGRIARTRLLVGASAAAILCSGAAAQAQEKPSISIAPQPLAAALYEFGGKTGTQVIFPSSLAVAKRSGGVTDQSDERLALTQLLAGTGLSFRREGDVFVILAQEGGSGPQSGSAAGEGAEVDALIVTAQKREEDIQDVPIAISAFTQKDLEKSQIAGGPDLFTQIPNMTFTKTNFASYSIQLRGIGTQAISATTDAAVAVAFNNTPFIRNRFFEQEFYDLERVEVLRGPQGTLYGRNATAGVVNIISAKPKFSAEAKLSADLGNYSSKRIEGMVNIPLVDDVVALRLAGAMTQRDGYATNQLTGNPIDGRDLWSTRMSLRFAPTDAIDVNLIWEHFQEDDDRLRSGKQLCKKDVVTEIGGLPVGYYQTLSKDGQNSLFSGPQALFSQGCVRNSLYATDSYETPNGLMLPYYVPLGAVFLPTALLDPYASTVQSRDLRAVESTVDPDYRAKSDLAELQVNFDITDGLTLTSETAYSADRLFSLQDFNRFNTAAGAWEQDIPGLHANIYREGVMTPGPNGGIFCDPQLGCSDRLVAVDISSAKSRQFSQEFRLGSDFDGAFNFSLGANYLRYDTEDKYYVFINSLSLISAVSVYNHNNQLSPYVAGVTDNLECLRNGYAPGNPDSIYGVPECTYMDPNPVGSLNDKGHNYFLSRNPYKLISYAVFGEAYYNLTDDLKITAGLRWTKDKKDAPRIPSWVLASHSVGYPVAEVIEQEWSEPTGRLAVDWKPDLSFTDDTLLYASYAHGYKAGGANPPTFVKTFYSGNRDLPAILDVASITRPRTFEPEFVDAFELGSKNTLLDGSLTLNLAAFYYDYEGYQISEIVDRSAINQNYDATVWGIELEADWRPFDNLRLGFKTGYLNTRIADGEQAIDLMDRTAGRDDWQVVRPFPTQVSSCILPTYVYLDSSVSGSGNGITGTPSGIAAAGNPGGGGPGGCEIAYLYGVDPQTGLLYVPNPAVISGAIYANNALAPGYIGFDPLDASQGHNNGEGFFKDLSGNALPNAPEFTATLTGDYTIPLGRDWLATLHTDLHWQSESWWRLFNDHEYGKLDEYFTMNLAAILTNEEAGWNIMVYAKNVTDKTAITGAFLNSDDTGLTTNVFLTEPRLYGLRVTKAWSGGGMLGSFGERRDPSWPYLFTVELGGQVQRHDAPSTTFAPSFLSAFDPAIRPHGDQNDNMDWGDGRNVRFTYAPGDWTISLGARIGETNGSSDQFLEGAIHSTCEFAAPCSGDEKEVADHGASEIVAREDYTVIDLLAGREIDLGVAWITRSRLSAGLRHATFDSSSNVTMYGTPDWQLPAEYWAPLLFCFPGPCDPPNPAQHTEYDGSLTTDRTFKGAGPVVSWEGASRLWGDDRFGHVELDWSLSGGVLFGEQKASGQGREAFAYWADQLYEDFPEPPTTEGASTFSFDRSKSVTVPTAALGLGLAYRIDAISVGAGYRWERYFDAIDGGIDEHESYDRTIDGPYFKLGYSFGG